jgi:hypothetical protein
LYGLVGTSTDDERHSSTKRPFCNDLRDAS